MKRAVVKPSMNIDFKEENNKNGPKFKVGDLVRISLYKNLFPKDYVSNRSEEAFVIEIVEITVQLAYAISNRNKEEIVRTF